MGLTLMLGWAAPAHAARCESARARAAAVSVEQLTGAITCLLNQQRRRAGLAPLDVSKRLGVAGWRHARDMRDHDYFSHVSLDGRTFVDRIRAARYLEGRESRTWTLGEVLAWSPEASSTPARIVRALMDSPTHHDVILDGRYLELGVGLVRGTPDAAVGDDGGVTVAVDFGSLASPSELRDEPTAPAAAPDKPDKTEKPGKADKPDDRDRPGKP